MIAPLGRTLVLAALCSPALSLRAAFAQSSQPAAGGAAPAAPASAPAVDFPFDGEVTADDVYVRCGPGSNYYPTTKVHAGDRLNVLGEQFGWLKIAPPAGSFSFVDMSLVEKTGADTGRVKGENVRVRAGSTLVTQRREVQTILPKDAVVSIIGEGDGFYKILPPPNACLWISGQYVRRFSGKPIARKTPRPSDAKPTQLAQTPTATPATTMPPATTGSATLPNLPTANTSAGTSGSAVGSVTQTASTAPASGGPKVTLITETDAALSRIAGLMDGSPLYGPRVVEAHRQLREVLQQPETDLARLEVLLQEFEAIAQQSDEPVAQAVARTQADQVRSKVDLLKFRRKIEDEQREVDAFRQKMGQDRLGIRTLYPPGQPRDYDVKGELRVSQVFGAGERKYRLVDPSATPVRTLAYVIVPEHMDENIAGMIGQYVGVRAASRSYDSGARVSVVLAESVEPLSATASAAASAPSP